DDNARILRIGHRRRRQAQRQRSDHSGLSGRDTTNKPSDTNQRLTHRHTHYFFRSRGHEPLGSDTSAGSVTIWFMGGITFLKITVGVSETVIPHDDPERPASWRRRMIGLLPAGPLVARKMRTECGDGREMTPDATFCHLTSCRPRGSNWESRRG